MYLLRNIESFRFNFKFPGPVAQLVEHRPFKAGCEGSNPSRFISFKPVHRHSSLMKLVPRGYGLKSVKENMSS